MEKASMIRRRVGIRLVATAAVVLTLKTQSEPAQALASQSAAAPMATACPSTSRATLENGIGVGDPKIFDNRSLALMVDSLSDSLRTTQFVDARALAASLGFFQGAQQDSVARSFTVQGAPLPGIVETVKDTAAANASKTVNTSATTASGQTGGQTTSVTGSGGQVTGTTATTTSGTTSSEGTTGTTATTSSTGGTQEKSTQTTTAPRTPTIPDLPSLIAAPGFAPQFGTNAADLLADQVNLTYQIFNLRMLLERALSDRLIAGSPRLQAVLGFNVALDPPRDSKDAAAFVEVTLTMRDGSKQPVSVVALMPQEKTYNSVALSTKSTAFGGAAVSQVISVGFNERKQSQLFYLFRDNDTIALQRSTGPAEGTGLGWSFRPVLGRGSVSPGVRQMFAVISLPKADATKLNVPLDVKVKTYWRKYDRKSLTTDSRAQAMTAEMSGCVLVPTTEEFQEKLSPRIDRIDWRMTDDKTALVTVEGRNFFQGTSIRLGGSAVTSPADGLTLKSDMALDLAVPVSALLGDGSLVGRYGVAKPLVSPNIPSGNLTIATVTAKPSVGGRTELTATLNAPSRSTWPGTFIVSLNGSVIPRPYDLSTDGKTLRVYLPTSQFADYQGLFSIRFPFAGDDWQSTFRLYDPNQAFTVTRFGAVGTDPASSTTKLLISTNDARANGFLCEADPAGKKPTATWKVVLDQKYEVAKGLEAPAKGGAVAVSPELIEFVAPSGGIDKHPLVLIDCGGTAFKIPVPKATPTPEKTSVDRVETDTVKVNDARKVTIKGNALDHVVSVTANGQKLDSHASSDGKSLDVFLIRKVTDQAATITLICRDDKGTILGSVDITVK